MTQTVAKKELTQSERFMNMVVSNFSTGVGEVKLTDFQKRLAQNYFISLDASLRMAEEKRQKKRGNNVEQLPVVWQNVNMEKLARDVVTYARIGFDPAQKNHINMVPFKNNTLGKYDIGFVEGYRGMELKAIKYGLNVPDNVTVEVVYSTDKFKSFKKDRNNKFDSYEFEINNEFDRGKTVGGFYYHEYFSNPEKNKLVVMNLKDIEKRKPQYASVEFWGGERDIWGKDPETGKNAVVGKEAVEGWYEKMVWKTIFRAAHGDVTIDSQKIDDDYLRLSQLEQEYAERSTDAEIAENANREIIDVTPTPQPPQEEPLKVDPDKKPVVPPPEEADAGVEKPKPSIENMELDF
jgi:recombination protein RecT